MRFLIWHNKTPVDVFSFCAKKLIYGGLLAVHRLCVGCALCSILCVACVLAVRLLFNFENRVRWLCVERKIRCPSVPHNE